MAKIGYGNPENLKIKLVWLYLNNSRYTKFHVIQSFKEILLWHTIYRKYFNNSQNKHMRLAKHLIVNNRIIYVRILLKTVF